jgi:hypothetical protein
LKIQAKLDPDMWRQIVDVVGIVASDIYVKFEPDAMLVRQLSSDKGNLVDIVLPASAFIEYKVDESQLVPMMLGTFAKLNRRMAGIQIIQLVRDDNFMTLTLLGEDIERRFDIPIIAVADDFKQANEPKLDVQAEFQVSPSLIRESLKDIALIGNLPTLKVEEDLIEFSIHDPASGGVSVKLSRGEELYGLTKNGKDLIACKYPVDKLQSVMDALIGTDPLFKIAHRKPLFVELAMADFGKLIIVVAPVTDRRTQPKKETEPAEEVEAE